MVKIESGDEQAVQDALLGMDVEVIAGILVNALQAKPELATVLVGVALPDMTYAPSSILTANRGHGTIKSYSASTGFGFIDCPELKEVFGRDVFVHGKQMKDLAVGSSVSFAVVLNKDNQPQAFDVCDGLGDGKGKSAKGGKGAGTMDLGFGKGAKDPWGGKGMPEPWFAMGADKGYGKMDKGWGTYDKGFGKGGWGGDFGAGPAKGSMKGCGKSDKGREPDVAEEIGVGVGTIKSYSEKNGYGFIDCPEIREMGHQDVFMHHAQMGNFQVGDEVAFTCFLNQKGNPQAKDLMTIAQAERQALGGGGGGGGGKSSQGKGKSAGSPDVKETLGQMTGTLKSFSENNGYGFISCAQVQEMGHKDVFLHQAQRNGFNVGDEVQFMAFLNAKGQVQALDLEGHRGAKRSRQS